MLALLTTVDGDSLTFVVIAVSALPNDIEALTALVAASMEVAEKATRGADESDARLANALACESARDALIAHLKLQIAKLKRAQSGASAEPIRRLLDQLEMQLEELEANASEDALVAEAAAHKTATVRSFERKAPARKLFPDHLARERVVIPSSYTLAVFVPGMRQRSPLQAGRGYH
jgi:transposase